MVYVAWQLSSGENDGTSNPFVEFICNSQWVISDVKL